MGAIFDAVPAGSPVTANQFNFLAAEVERCLAQCPSTSSFSYLGEVGTTTSLKSNDEYSTAIAVPVPSVVATASATCNLLLGPVLYSGAAEASLTQTELKWSISGRAVEDAVGTQSTTNRPTAWANNASSDPLGAYVNAVSLPVTFGATAANKYTGAFLALKLAGTWGYSGNIPGFIAFCSF